MNKKKMRYPTKCNDYDPLEKKCIDGTNCDGHGITRGKKSYKGRLAMNKCMTHSSTRIEQIKEGYLRK